MTTYGQSMLLKLLLLFSASMFSANCISEEQTATHIESIQALVSMGKHEQLRAVLQNVATNKIQAQIEAIEWALRYRQTRLADNLAAEIIEDLEFDQLSNLFELAVSFNAPRLVQSLLERDQRLLKYDRTRPILHTAVETGAYHAAQALLNEGERDGIGKAIIVAVQLGHVDVVWLLMGAIELSEMPINEKIHLMTASIYSGQLTILQHLVDQGVSVNLLYPSGPHVALAAGRPDSDKCARSCRPQIQIYEFLVASGLDECLMRSSFDDEDLAQIENYSSTWFKQKITDLEESCL